MLVNLTQHTLNIYEGGKKIATIPSDGQAARIRYQERGEFRIEGLPVERVALGEMQQLPEPADDSWYIVSQVAALALLARGVKRDDVLIPGPTIGKGKILGCRGLIQLQNARV